jgi:hypothetical protein
LTPYNPVDGPDHRFGQLHKPLSPEAYKAAGIDGFAPPSERFDFSNRKHFDESDIPSPPRDDDDADVNPALVVDFQSWPHKSDDDDLHFPSLWELNQEISDYGDINLDDLVDDVQPISPQQQDHTYHTKPSAATLASNLVSSKCKLFFISWSAPACNRREWHLVRVNLSSSIAYNPECLSNGKFLVEFFICHPNDTSLHPRNQRWWLEYHSASSVARLHSGDYHILRPDSRADAYAKERHLHPFAQWVNLLHDATFIHGPFDFAVINGRQSRDRISVDDWSALAAHADKYDDSPPDMKHKDMTGLQFSRNFHTTVTDTSVRARVLATHFLMPEIYSTVPLDL